jgi:hypothetical protein
MAAIDRSTQRVIAVITLLILAAVALRGYIPGAERIADRERPESSPAALGAVIAMLCAAVAIIAFAIISRLRERKPGPPPVGALPRSPGGATGRPSWRFWLIALAVVISWLVLVLLLMQITGPDPAEQTAATPPETSEPSAVQPPPETTPPDRSEDPDPGTNVVNYLIPPMLVLMVLIVVGTAVASRRQRREVAEYYVGDDPDDGPDVPAASDSLARAAEVGLAEIGDLTREPREAIIACYAAMERELTRVPGAMPQDFDTPTEVLARAVNRGALRVDSATELVELFEEARFSPHVMTETHRDAAVRVLERVLAELPQGVG